MLGCRWVRRLRLCLCCGVRYMLGGSVVVVADLKLVKVVWAKYMRRPEGPPAEGVDGCRVGGHGGEGGEVGEPGRRRRWPGGGEGEGREGVGPAAPVLQEAG